MLLLNIINLIAYLVNTLITFGVGVSGKFPTNAELSAKYQTLVTPAGYAFAIWSIIFLVQLIWSIIQLTFSKYQSHPLVVNDTGGGGGGGGGGVGYLYVSVCFFQCLWTIVFSLEFIPFSLVAMVSILISLVLILERFSSESSSTTTTTTILEYWLLKFPFEIHCGWIWAASLVNLNLVFVASNASPTVQTKLAWVSLLLCVPAIAIYYAWWKQVYVVPVVLSWALYAINVELNNPRDSITNKFDGTTIDNLRDVSKWLSLILLVGTFVVFLLRGNTESVSAWVSTCVVGISAIVCFCWRPKQQQQVSSGGVQQLLVAGEGGAAATSYQ